MTMYLCINSMSAINSFTLWCYIVYLSVLKWSMWQNTFDSHWHPSYHQTWSGDTKLFALPWLRKIRHNNTCCQWIYDSNGTVISFIITFGWFSLIATRHQQILINQQRRPKQNTQRGAEVRQNGSIIQFSCLGRLKSRGQNNHVFSQMQNEATKWITCRGAALFARMFACKIKYWFFPLCCSLDLSCLSYIGFPSPASHSVPLTLFSPHHLVHMNSFIRHQYLLSMQNIEGLFL